MTKGYASPSKRQERSVLGRTRRAKKITLKALIKNQTSNTQASGQTEEMCPKDNSNKPEQGRRGTTKVVTLKRCPKQVGKPRKCIEKDNSNKLEYGWRETNKVVPLKRCPE